jgi:phage terminase large subunit-like protein
LTLETPNHLIAKQRNADPPEDYDFRLFYAVWVSRLGLDVPEVHLRIIDFLEDGDWQRNTKVLLLWRGVGKSSLVDLWVAYMLSKNPRLRFLFLSATFEVAKASSQDILHIIQTHPLCVHLRTKTKETRKDSFFVRGSIDARVPSVRAMAITSNIVGMRADYAVFDDCEGDRNSGSDYKRHELRRAIQKAGHLLVPEVGKKLFVGTFNDTVSIYDDEIITGGASRLRIPLLENATGEFPYMEGYSNWPERFDDEWIAEKQKTMSRAEWQSQYLLIPTSIADSILDPSLIHVYTDEIEYSSVNRRRIAKIGETKMATVSAWWDPAVSDTRRQDDSVLAIVYTSEDGYIFIHRTFLLGGIVEEQCKQIRRYALEYQIPIVKVEINGIGAYLPQLLLKALDGTGVGVDGIYTSKNKNTKIIEALETPIYARIVHMHKQVADSPFSNQVRDFDPGTNKNKDDYVDAVASAISEEPIRIAAGLTFDGGMINTNTWVDNGSVEISREQFRFSSNGR